MQSVAQAWLVLELTGSAFKLGIIGALQFGPMLLFSFLAGAVADRVPQAPHDHLHADRAHAAGLRPGPALLVRPRAVLARGDAGLLLRAGQHPATCRCGRPSWWRWWRGKPDLPNAIALNSAMFSGARMIGPAVAGLVIARYGVAPAFALNGLSFLAVIFALSAMHAEGRPRRGERRLGQGRDHRRPALCAPHARGRLWCWACFSASASSSSITT